MAGVEGSETIFNMVFFVVLVSSLIQGPTLGWTAKRLGVLGPRGESPAAPPGVVAAKAAGLDPN